MKKLLYIVLIFPIIFACSSDSQTASDDEPDAMIDPTIISQYHRLSGDDIFSKYFFDDTGRFERIQRLITFGTAEPYTISFTYNANDQIINITKTNLNNVLVWSRDVTYDINDRVTSIGDRTFTFDDSDNSYIDDITYFTDSFSDADYMEVEIIFTKYFESTNGIVTSCRYEEYTLTDLNTNEIIDQSIACVNGGTTNFGYSNNIGEECGQTDCVNYTYDSMVNPMLSSTNFIYLYGFINEEFSAQPFELNVLVNHNNMTKQDYSDPIEIHFEYDFNTLGLPTKARSIFQDELGTQDPQDYANYYYQGDIIPE